jgi:hypothetical protein
VKKAMATGIFFLSFWFSSLELKINNEMMVFFMLKVVTAIRKKLINGGGDLEVQTKMLFHHHRQLVSKMFLHQK